MNQLIIGYGEIGQALQKVIRANYILDLTEASPILAAGCDVMHICFPYSDSFVTDVKNYVERYSPAHVVIYSTVPIGTTYDISPLAVHSPIEGKHPELEMSIRFMERWIGYNDTDEKFFFVNLFSSFGLRTKPVENTNFTEALKLLSTTEYGLNIEFARYKKKVAKSLGMDYKLTKEWNEEYNKLYRNLGMDKRYQKYVLDAPKGKKGGHCIVPNAQLLQQQFPDKLVAIVGEIE